MNKLLKGAIAGAAGVALLLGGAGTLASWNSSAVVGGGKIVAGRLAVLNDSLPTGSWSDQTGPILDLSTYRIVPGDTLTFTGSVNIFATGKNMVATLSVAPGSITGTKTTDPAADAANKALARSLTKTATVSASGTGITGSGPTYTVTDGAAQRVEVTATITFPKGTLASNNSAKQGSVDLSGFAVSLTQN